MDENTPVGANPAGQPPPAGGTPPAPQSGTDSFFDSIRRSGLRRSEDRWIGGVAGGLALRMGIDPLIVRGVLGVSVLLGGLGLVLYGVGWLLMPEERDGRIHLQQLFRGDFDAAVIGGFALLVLGFAFPGRWFPGFWWGGDSSWWQGVVGLAVVGVIVAVVASAASRNRGPAQGSGPSTSLPRTYPAAGAPPTATAPVPPVAAQRPEGTPMHPAPSAPPPTGPGPHTTTAARPAMPPVPPYGPPPVPPRRPAGPQTAMPKPSTKGPGTTAAGIVVALGLLVLASLLYAERVGAFDGPVLLTAAASLIVLAGLGIAVAGFLGRSSGGLGAIAIVTILVVAPIAAATDVTWHSSTTAVGDVTYAPTEVATAERGYSVGVGQVRLDLTEIPLDGPTVEVPVNVGAGDLTVIMPEDGAFAGRIRVMAGELTWLDEATWDGVRSHGFETYESPAVRRGATPDIELEITVGAGSVRVVEEGR